MSACRACGAALAANTQFCQSCGSPTELRADAYVPEVESLAAVVVMSPSGQAGSKKMDTNVVGELTYLAGFVTGIVFLLLNPYKSNSFVRFHAFQSIIFNVVLVAFWILPAVHSSRLCEQLSRGETSVQVGKTHARDVLGVRFVINRRDGAAVQRCAGHH